MLLYYPGCYCTTPDATVLLRTCFFFAETFRSFVSQLVLKLAITLFVHLFCHATEMTLFFFGHFKIISVYDRKKEPRRYRGFSASFEFR